MNSTRDEAETVVSISTMRTSASFFLAQTSLPPYGTVKVFEKDFRRFLVQQIPRIEQLTGKRPKDDVPARAALAGVGEARRRLGLPERPGLSGEVERVKRLARSVVALCDHCDTLTGIRMCLICDQQIEEGHKAIPYDLVSPSGGAVRSGRVHTGCGNAARR